jgi:ankyrin repeat protein
LENVFGDTPLIWAAAAGHSDVVRILLIYYSDFSEKRWQLATALGRAAVRGYDDVVKEILKDPVTRYSHKKSLELTPLALAAALGRQGVVQTLLSNPYVNGKKQTIFRRAIIAGDATTVKTMINTNPKMLKQYQKMYFETAVHTAIDSGNYNVARHLLPLEDFPITYKRRFDGYPTVLH